MLARVIEMYGYPKGVSVALHGPVKQQAHAEPIESLPPVRPALGPAPRTDETGAPPATAPQAGSRSRRRRPRATPTAQPRSSDAAWLGPAAKEPILRLSDRRCWRRPCGSPAPWDRLSSLSGPRT